MLENWDRSVNHALLWEGGFADRSDPRVYAHPEYVNHGITLTTYREYYPHATKEDIKNLTDEQATKFYHDCEPAPQIGFDKLPSGYDLAMLHCAIMFGVHGGHAFDEKAKGDLGLLVVLMMHNKMHRPDGLKYMPGWSDRFLSIYTTARELQDGKPSV